MTEKYHRFFWAPGLPKFYVCDFLHISWAKKRPARCSPDLKRIAGAGGAPVGSTAPACTSRSEIRPYL